MKVLFTRAALPALVLVASACAPAARTDLPPPEYEKPRPLPAATADATAEPAPTAAPSGPPAKMCTKMGCTSALALEFDGVNNKKGKYTIKVQGTEGTGTCEMTLPFPKCGEPISKCEGTIPVMVDESGDPCKAPAKEQKLLVMRVGAAPEKLEVVVTRDKKEVAKASLAPTYETKQPNGPDCEPTCKVGSTKVTLK